MQNPLLSILCIDNFLTKSRKPSHEARLTTGGYLAIQAYRHGISDFKNLRMAFIYNSQFCNSHSIWCIRQNTVLMQKKIRPQNHIRTITGNYMQVAKYAHLTGRDTSHLAKQLQPDITLDTCTLLQIYLFSPNSHPHKHGHEDVLMTVCQKTPDPVPRCK